MLSDADIQSRLSAPPDPNNACEALIAAANNAGGKDNITALTIEITA